MQKFSYKILLLIENLTVVFYIQRTVGKCCKIWNFSRTSSVNFFFNNGRYHGQKFDSPRLATFWTGNKNKKSSFCQHSDFDFLEKPLHVCLLGLDSAGKTTALYRMKFDQYLNTVPTIGFNCEKIRGTVGRAKGVSFLVWGKKFKLFESHKFL